MSLVLDAGALIALERHDRAMWRRFKLALQASDVPKSHGGVVGQVWRGRGSRQATLARALEAVDVRSLDHSLGRAAGGLLAASRKNDVIDAALVLVSDDDDVILTSDVDDIERLAEAAGRLVDVVKV